MTRAISRRQLLALRVPDVPPRSTHWVRVHRTAMACRFEVLLPGEDARFVPAARLALDEADRIEALLTVFRDDSEVMRVNRTAGDAPARVDAELFALLESCAELSDRTDGAFDLTSAPFSRCWGFLRRSGRLPAPEELAAVRALVGMSHVRLDRDRRSV